MRKLIILLFIFFASHSFSQNFPYMNASTGNPDFFTDKDTNLYMAHGNRLVKTDKNFNPVWANTYGSLNLKRMLLSTTGAMYFIAGNGSVADVIGKLTPAGAVSWMRSTSNIALSVSGSTVTSATVSCSNFFLDSNNNLLLAGLISGPGNLALIKLDTLGNFISARTFSIVFSGNSTQCTNASVVNQANGKINMAVIGYPVGLFTGKELATVVYSESGDSIVSRTSQSLGGCSNCTATFNYQFYKSRTRSDIFYIAGDVYQQQFSTLTQYAFVAKYNMSSALWSRGYNWFMAGIYAKSFDEDEEGNSFSVIGNAPGASYSNGVFRLDSNGAGAASALRYFNNYNTSPSFIQPGDRVNAIHKGRTFMNVSGSNFPITPLLTETISPAFSMNCGGATTLSSVSSSGASALAPGSKPFIYTVTAMSMTALSPTVAPVTNFSVSPTFCMYMNIGENGQNEGVSVYPNPVKDKLHVATEGRNIQLGILNVFGQIVLEKVQMSLNGEADLSELATGLYFVELYEDGKLLTMRKVVKEN